MTDPSPKQQAGPTIRQAEPASPDPATTIVAEGDATPGASSRPSPGQIVSSRFQIIRIHGRGGMGEIHEAEDLELRTRIALKIVRPEVARDPRGLARFQREIQLARQVTHPNVCRVFDFRQDPPWPPYLTMELLSGEILAANGEANERSAAATEPARESEG
jgi:serine/threonine protein kinase